jgi:hypothetical protein
MSLSARILFCVLVAILSVCAVAAIQVYSGGPYSNTLALMMGVAVFFVTLLATSKHRVPWWWWGG